MALGLGGIWLEKESIVAPSETVITTTRMHLLPASGQHLDVTRGLIRQGSAGLGLPAITELIHMTGRRLRLRAHRLRLPLLEPALRLLEGWAIGSAHK